MAKRKPPRVEIPRDVYERLVVEAKRRGVPVEKLLEQVLEGVPWLN